MRFTIAASAALLAASSVNALGELAFNLGVKIHDGTCKYTQDYLEDLDVLKPYTDTIKFYASSDCNTLQWLGPALEQKNFKAFVGVWPHDDAHLELEKAALRTYLPRMKVSTVRAFLVGSETLYRDDMSSEELASKIKEVRDVVHELKDVDGNSYSSVPVGTVDSWNVLVDGRAKSTIEASDIVFANAFAYWEGREMHNSSYTFIDDIMQALQTIQTTKGTTDITFFVGETGWATEGGNFGQSYPSISNARLYWKEAICAIRAWGINTIVFEAFDEDWKPVTSGISDVENHWGVFTANRELKYPLDCDFD
ncbi:HFR119Wp [Eremothecium sinecaudum]|uniref:glucan 1,3-beta-glucosidase n=1 Tax=Eremothecium sinecaudum TaxID=45286 RepID=A0A0X8HUX1_9SACH|nr:HFR119Wp [Eremothecium sinecaudum]AMD21974.1 HFR119Wp [Eremothecium sinecaudum]